MARDIGGYFEKLTKQARGGRRLDSGTTASPSSGSGRGTKRRSGTSSGGLGDMLKDVLRKGRSTAGSAGEKVATKARERINPTSARSRKSGGRASMPPGGVVAIEYSPRIDGDPDPGEVVWTWVPFEEDADQGKDRPVVVIGRRNRGLVGVPLTTRENDREAQIAIGTGDWDPERRPSYARIWRMLDIDADRTRREGAVLDRDRFDDVVAAVDEYYEIRRPGESSKRDDFDYDY